uniref:Peptidase M12B propeptide domain-containing protein n=1 Tax=Acanthochromis polyacanthus TaxID=80966 RepID=A0A3Q1FBW6_9TELE
MKRLGLGTFFKVQGSEGPIRQRWRRARPCRRVLRSKVFPAWSTATSTAGKVALLVAYCFCFQQLKPSTSSSSSSELDTDQVVPRLLSGQEAHLSSDHTVLTLQRRGQRSLNSPRKEHSDPDNIILSLPAFGRNLYLNLTRDSTFLSKDFVVEERHSDQNASVSRLSTQQLCFYSGSIINHTDSLASLSTCSGLVNPSSFLTCS